MAMVSKRVSDVSGKELDSNYVNVVIKGHSQLDESKQIDVSDAEAKSIKTVDGLVELELRPSKGDPRTVYCTEEELAKVVPLEVLQYADGLRGRRKNFRPGKS